LILFTLLASGQQPELLKDIIPQANFQVNSPGISGLTVLDDKLIFVVKEWDNYFALWSSDGTEEGTVKYFTLPQNNPVGSFVVVNNKLFFGYDNGINGRELWVTDGTEEGTTMVKDIAPGSSDGLVHYNASATYNGEFYFSANNTIVNEELWKSDGTEAGTVLVKDLHDSNTVDGPGNFIEANGVLFFTKERELWKTDGTESGTELVFTFATEWTGVFESYNNEVYFAVKGDFDDGIELWKSDGTSSGTAMVADINPSGDSSPLRLTVSNNYLFFSANDGVNGRALYRTDGSESGTLMLTNHDGLQFKAALVVDVNGKLFVESNDGISGWEWWITDGSLQGHSLVADINPGVTPGAIVNPKAVDDLLFFGAWQFSPNIGSELWVSDGTTSGTYLVHDLAAGEESSSPSQLTKFKNALFFVAFDTNFGWEIRKLDLSNFTGIKESHAISHKVKIYPNPIDDLISIDFEENFTVGEKIQIEFYDVTGKKLRQTEEQMERTMKINCSFLNPGIFLMVIRHEDQNIPMRVVKL